LKKAIASVLAALALGCSPVGDVKHEHAHEGFTKHYSGSHFELTEKETYSVEMVLPAGHDLVVGPNTVDVIVHDWSDRDVTGATLTITPWMPTMGHGVREVPVVTEKGGGRYTVDNIVLTMGGMWELKVTVDMDSKVDTAVFTFPDVQKDEHGHGHMATRVPDNLDLSTTVMSKSAAFELSYDSEQQPIPINAIHSWKLTLKDFEGKPVEGAVISVDGDMPEHGHGLPTTPEVTDDLGGGVYMVEGIRFSMPGWWIMNFSIDAGGKTDSAKFNLMVKQ